MRFLTSLFGFATLIVLAMRSTPTQSPWVHPGADGKLIYKTTPRGDRILDFSYAGYRGGGVPIPTVPVRQTVTPSGAGKEDTAAIQAALDAVAQLPLRGGSRGAVLLGAGEFVCSAPLRIPASGVVLRGSGIDGATRTTLKLIGQPHVAITVGVSGSNRGDTVAENGLPHTTLADTYVPSGTRTFRVAATQGFAVGDTIALRRPVTPAWIKFMQMDDLVREGKPQTWIRAGTRVTTERRITSITGDRLTVDVPLTDSYDAHYLSPPGTEVVKITPPVRLSEVGIENLRIASPPQNFNHSQPHFSAVRLNGEDCWMRDVVSDETMNSIGIGGRRITLERVAVHRQVAHVGSSKPAEFAPNGSQVLLDRCSVTADNVWYVATGANQSGPMVVLNCTFEGNGRAESHQRWSTGILYDNCRVPGGGIELRNRGAMGSGHGWSMGWGVIWNCVAKDYLVQNPPGAVNWLIGCVGPNKTAARPFGTGPLLPEGIVDSPGTPVAPQSLYLMQLKERLGDQAVRNLGYTPGESITVANATGNVQNRD